MKGKVTLIGAGPGDERLLTLGGKEALRSADVVIYDRLVGEGILSLIPDAAETIDAGKSSGNHTLPQEEINQLLLEKALEGKSVARLKGGDPFLFGRGGEELELLAENGVEFRVIPGVTSALAVPAYAGIPVTHRDYASSVHIFTAHAKAGSEPNIDFDSCVKIGGTLIFLMGAARIGYIAAGLLDAGMDGDTPTAVIESGTTARQKKHITTLGGAAEFKTRPPAVIIVGKTAALGDRFDWFHRLPLLGKTVVNTRERAAELSRLLRAEGAKIIECAAIRTNPFADKRLFETIRDELRRCKTAVFTSPVGVKTVMSGLFSIGCDARAFGGTALAAIGSATEAELLKHGLKADYVPLVYNGERLGRLLADKADEPFLLLRAEKAGRELPDALCRAGMEYKEIAVYETIEGCKEDLTDRINKGEIDFVTFTSASCARGFMKTHSEADTSNFIGIAIGASAAEEAKRFGIRCVTAERADMEGMTDAVKRAARGDTIENGIYASVGY